MQHKDGDLNLSCLNYVKNKDLLTINIQDVHAYSTLTFYFHSSRNHHITKATDISASDMVKERHDHLKKKYPLHEIYFPVIDMELEDDMKAAAEFSGGDYTGGEYCLLNIMFRELRKPLDKKVVFDAEDLEYWENQLFVDSKNVLEKFYVTKEMNTLEKDSLSYEVKLLTEKWSGVIIVTGRGTDGTISEIGKVAVDDDKENHDIYTAVKPASMKRERVVEALTEACDFLARSQCKNKRSKAYNGLYLYYDYDERIFRHPTWIWTWGIAIKALLDASGIEELKSRYEPGYLQKLADDIGHTSLSFQMLDQSHPAYGLLMFRYDADLQYEQGSSGFLSPADSLFMAGYGWMPLYKATGNERYLEATKLMVDETQRILSAYPVVIEQDYVTAEKEWKDWIMDESGFGMVGFTELYKVLPEAGTRYLAKEYIEKILHIFDRGDGFWNRLWWKSCARVSLVEYNTKGFGWAMIGLLNSYKMLGEEKYLKKAKVLADNVISYQQEDGKWYMFLEYANKREGNGGICEKSTALWSFLLYELYEVTGESKYLGSARRALHWCIGHQYNGNDKFGHGAIPVCASGSGLNFRQYFNMCTSYGVSFMAAALVKELKLSDK